MNDQPGTGDDELASATLDGEVTTDERVRVESSPALAHELSTYRTLGARIADVPVAAADRDRAIEAALAAFDTPVGTASDQPVVTLASRRASRMRPLLAAAAAVAAVGVGLGVWRSSTEGTVSSDARSSPAGAVVIESSAASVAVAANPAPAQQQSSASASDAASAAAGEVSAASAAAGNPAAPASTTAASAPPELVINGAADVSWFGAPELTTDADIVAFVDGDQFGEHPTDTTAAPNGSAPDGSVPATTAAAVTCEPLTRGTVGRAVVAGRNVFVVRDDTAREALVIDPQGCAVVRIVALPPSHGLRSFLR